LCNKVARSCPRCFNRRRDWICGISGVCQNIIDDWGNVQVPRAPELKNVTIDPKTTALLVMGFVRDSCNIERRPRCAATIPAVAKLLSGARANGVFVMHSVPSTNPGGDYIVKELAPLPGEAVIPPNGPNKFLPVDPEFPQFSDFDLDKILNSKGIKDAHHGGHASADRRPPHSCRGSVARVHGHCSGRWNVG